MTYRYRVILEALGEGLGYQLLVLLLDDTGSGGKNTESCFSLASIWRDTELEENSQEIGPRLAML
jgi:hypothetical protein